MGTSKKEKYVSTRIIKNFDFKYRIPDSGAKVFCIVSDQISTLKNQLVFSNFTAGPQPAVFILKAFTQEAIDSPNIPPHGIICAKQ